MNNRPAQLHAQRSREIGELMKQCRLMSEALQTMEAQLRKLSQTADEEYLLSINSKNEE